MSTAAAFSRLDIRDAAIREGDEGYVEAVFTIELDQPSSFMVSVVWRAVGVTAKPTTVNGPGDFGLAAGYLEIPAGQTRAEIRVAILGDKEIELDETFEIVLSDISGATPGRTTATGTIIDNDGTGQSAPTLKIQRVPQGGLRISWMDGGVNWALQTSGSAASGPWVPAVGAISAEAGETVQAVEDVAPRAFFQLKRSP